MTQSVTLMVQNGSDTEDECENKRKKHVKIDIYVLYV